MAGVLDSDIGILDKDHSESKRLHEVEDNHRTEIDSLLEQNESKNDQSVVSYDTEKHTSVKNRVQIINAQLQTTAEPTTSNNLPLSANQIDSNNRPSKEKVRTSMSKKWKFINPRLKCFIRILIISIVVAGLVGATAFITQAFVKKVWLSFMCWWFYVLFKNEKKILIQIQQFSVVQCYSFFKQ